ncbi:MAG: methyltransferase domain-containing protein [Solirubrobacterales bacterium]|nr:methyltransferase domain-containing protein [Solirubrobacterales bacterium]
MEKTAVDLLICPHCGGDLRENKGSLICSRGHTANIARQGYVSLLGRDSGTHTADSAEMVAARERFLDGGHFEPLAEALVAASEGAPEGAVVDLGCGTGHYLGKVLEALPDRVGIGVDNSKFAARRAAKIVPRAGVLVADIWDEIPIRDGAAGLMLNVFSPRNGEEMERILAPGGRLVVVTPQAGHLAELIERFGMISVDPEKEERLERSLGPLADGAESRELEWTMNLGRDQVRDLIEMGPSAGRMGGAEMDSALQELAEETAVTAAVTITTTSRIEEVR